MRGTSREAHTVRLVAKMQRTFGECSPDMIETEVRDEYERLCRGSKVTEFVPILPSDVYADT